MDSIFGDDPYGPVAERIIFHGLTRSELGEIGTLKEGRSFADLIAAVDKAKHDSAGRAYEFLAGNIAHALKGVITLKNSSPR